MVAWTASGSPCRRLQRQSSHVGFMGTLNQFRNVGRVALFIGPDDGDGGTTEATWIPATYIEQTEVPTGTRYDGLVHVSNKAVGPNSGEPVFPEPLYQVTKNWLDLRDGGGRSTESAAVLTRIEIL